MIHTAKSKIHWNYFIALEKDLETISRYIEFSEDNFKVYSIELASLLFAAASEVDVMAKLLCKRFQPTAGCDNINDYRQVLLAELPEIPTTEVFIGRYGLSFKPWENWNQTSNRNPIWWSDYNKVKHQRDAYFGRATLKNAVNSLGALLIFVYCHYSYELATNAGERLHPKETMRQLEPDSTLLRLPDSYYHGHLLI